MQPPCNTYRKGESVCQCSNILFQNNFPRKTFHIPANLLAEREVRVIEIDVFMTLSGGKHEGEGGARQSPPSTVGIVPWSLASQCSLLWVGGIQLLRNLIGLPDGEHILGGGIGF